MGEFTTLMARDGHEFSAYLSAPAGKPRGAIVVVQEIFGVNHHIKAVTDGFAAQGYVAIAPALFDRVRRGVDLGYSPAETQEGIGYMLQVKRENILADLSAAIAVTRHAGKVGVVGYCWGGTLAYAAACRLPGVAAAVGYYGGGIAGIASEKPRIPLMLHFGERDKHIPLSDVERIRAAQPEVPVFVYAADHGFNCDERESYDAAAAQEAELRTMEFFAAELK